MGWRCRDHVHLLSHDPHQLVRDWDDDDDDDHGDDGADDGVDRDGIDNGAHATSNTCPDNESRIAMASMKKIFTMMVMMMMLT